MLACIEPEVGSVAISPLVEVCFEQSPVWMLKEVVVLEVPFLVGSHLVKDFSNEVIHEENQRHRLLAIEAVVLVLE